MPDTDTSPGVIVPGTDSVDFTARYTVDGYPGVAWRATRYATTEQYEGDQLVCGDDECDHQLSEMCWTVGDTSLVTDLDMVVAVMVGDDREHLVDVASLTKITDDEFCGGCGQVGCVADTRTD